MQQWVVLLVVQARIMADEEEREVRRCVLAAAEAQMDRITIKLRHFDTLENVLDMEREALAVRTLQETGLR